MAELSYPTTGGGSVTDANYEKLIGTTVASGLVGNATQSDLVYGDSSGRQVKVRANRAAMVRGYRWETDGAGITRSIAANTSGQPRVDLAVLRLNRSDWTVTFQIVQGTPAASPVSPSPTQNEGPSGVWELPLAQISVANQASTITAANVTARAPYQGSFMHEGPKAFPPPSAMNPRIYWANDAGRMNALTPNGYQIFAERGSEVTGTVSSGWTAQTLRFVRWNGFVWMYAQISRSGGNLAADTEVNVFNVPAAYRPAQNGDIAFVGYAGSPVRLYFDISSGWVALQDYTFQFNTGNTITVHPAIWPAQNL